MKTIGPVTLAVLTLASAVMLLRTTRHAA